MITFCCHHHCMIVVYNDLSYFKVNIWLTIPFLTLRKGHHDICHIWTGVTCSSSSWTLWLTLDFWREFKMLKFLFAFFCFWLCLNYDCFLFIQINYLLENVFWIAYSVFVSYCNRNHLDQCKRRLNSALFFLGNVCQVLITGRWFYKMLSIFGLVYLHYLRFNG